MADSKSMIIVEAELFCFRCDKPLRKWLGTSIINFWTCTNTECKFRGQLVLEDKSV